MSGGSGVIGAKQQTLLARQKRPVQKPGTPHENSAHPFLLLNFINFVTGYQDPPPFSNTHTRPRPERRIQRQRRKKTKDDVRRKNEIHRPGGHAWWFGRRRRPSHGLRYRPETVVLNTTVSAYSSGPENDYLASYFRSFDGRERSTDKHRGEIMRMSLFKPTGNTLNHHVGCLLPAPKQRLLRSI
jgi:hypothetical protein